VSASVRRLRPSGVCVSCVSASAACLRLSGVRVRRASASAACLRPSGVCICRASASASRPRPSGVRVCSLSASAPPQMQTTCRADADEIRSHYRRTSASVGPFSSRSLTRGRRQGILVPNYAWPNTARQAPGRRRRPTRVLTGARGRGQGGCSTVGSMLAIGRCPTARVSPRGRSPLNRSINAKRRGTSAVILGIPRRHAHLAVVPRGHIDSRSHAIASSAPGRFQRMARRVPSLPTSREPRVCAPTPPQTAYLILELGRPSVSKAWDVPRLGVFHAAVAQRSDDVARRTAALRWRRTRWGGRRRRPR
jgi:hypothetical protein